MEPQNPPRTIRQNLRVLIPVAMVQSAVYLTLNHWQWRPVRDLPLSVVDEWVPFLPWTVIPYMLFFLGGFPVALTIRSDAVLRRGVIAYFLCLAMTAPIFLLWPTACPPPGTQFAGAVLGFVALRMADDSRYAGVQLPLDAHHAPHDYLLGGLGGTPLVGRRVHRGDAALVGHNSYHQAALRLGLAGRTGNRLSRVDHRPPV